MQYLILTILGVAALALTLGLLSFVGYLIDACLTGMAHYGFGSRVRRIRRRDWPTRFWCLLLVQIAFFVLIEGGAVWVLWHNPLTGPVIQQVITHQPLSIPLLDTPQ
jgi:hypothetical protein